MKNPNGFGSVYQLSGPRRRPWAARVTVGWRRDGKQIRKVIGYYETRQKALAALGQYHAAPFASKAGITLGELYREWSAETYPDHTKGEEYNRGRITKSTADNYRAAWKYLSIDENVKMSEYRAAHIRAVIQSCAEKGLSKSTLQKVRTLAYMLCSRAMEENIITKNYASFVKLDQFDEPEKERFSDIEVQKLSKLRDPWADTIMILLYSGMRINEMLGMTRFNVDLQNRVFTNIGIKTAAGKERIVPIFQEIYPIIKRRYDAANEYIVPGVKGGRCNAGWYRSKIYYPLLEKAGVRKLTPHCCRHTFASKLSAMGYPPATIKYILGHSSFSTTAQTYIHPTPEELRPAELKY